MYMVCSNCGTENHTNSDFCANCGMNLSTQRSAQEAQNRNDYDPNMHNNFNQQGGAGAYGNQYNPNMGYYDPYNHTSEFDRGDISQNKVFAMLPYLMGWLGVIVAMLAARESKYAGFHVRQSLKLTVVKTLLGIVALLLCWTVIVPIIAGIMYLVLWIIQIICFFSVCSGNAKEAPFVRSLNFLR